MELVRIENGQVYADSLMVATAFGKNHRDVIRNIDILIANMVALKSEVNAEITERKIALSSENQENQSKSKIGLSEYTELKFEPSVTQFFILSEYKDPSGKKNKMYKMTKNGFALLVMGFTGLRALEWKLRYIEAYDNMEKQFIVTGKQKAAGWARLGS